MSKFLAETLENAFGIGFFPAFSLLLFIILFVGVVFWVIKADSKKMNKMKNIPFEEEPASTSSTNI
jgi:cbb3-type cytochrome oxidase subunit 3